MNRTTSATLPGAVVLRSENVDNAIPLWGTNGHQARASEDVGPSDRVRSMLADDAMVTQGRLFVLIFLWVYCIFAWIIGAFLLPSLQISILPDTQFENVYQKSLLLTVLDLLKKGEYFATATLGTFSVVVPTLKLASTFFLIVRMFFGTLQEIYMEHRKMILTLSYIASYQLLDLYVGIFFVGHFNSDSADCSFLNGFYWFFSYCMSSLVMSVTLDNAFYGYEEMYQELRYELELEEERRRGNFDGTDSKDVGMRPVVEDANSALYGWLDQACVEEHPLCGGKVQRWSPGRSAQEELEGVDATPEEELAPWAGGLRLPHFVDSKSVWLLTIAFALMLNACIMEPVLEVRTMFKGVAIDRSIRPLDEIFGSFLRKMAPPALAYSVIFMNFVAPVLYIVSLLALSLAYCCAELPGFGGTRTAQSAPFFRACCVACDSLRPWATTDVLCYASLVFVFTVQDARTLTMPLDGSHSYYYWLGVGFSLFFLRWFAEGGRELEAVVRKFNVVPTPRFWAVVGIWFLLCFFLSGGFAVIGGYAGSTPALGAPVNRVSSGLPGSLPHYQFPSLDTVCLNAAPLMNSTLRHALPVSVGNCGDTENPAPGPCEGNKTLYEQHDGNNFIEAKWLSGINTVRLNVCRLWKDAPVWDPGATEPRTQYHLNLAGQFDIIQLFLHVRQCGKIPLLGCTSMNSANHCCGKNIRFSITFGMGCMPSQGWGQEAFRDVHLEDCHLDPMIVDTEFMDGALEIDALDIAPKIEKVVKDQLTSILARTRLMWAGQNMDIPQLLNHLIKYNSPGSAGAC